MAYIYNSDNPGGGEEAFENAKRHFSNFVSGLVSTWNKLSEPVKEHIGKHPTATAFQVVAVSVALVPGLVVAPVLGLMGFSSVGPVAVSAAAAYQSANGATAAFSTFQSAAMGGFGAPVVNGIAAGVSGATAGVLQGWKWATGTRD